MIRARNTILVGLILLAGCSTYIENEASLAFEPIYPSAHVTPEGEAPTGGIFKAKGMGCLQATSVLAMLATFSRWL